MHLLLVGGGHAMLQTVTAAASWPIPDLHVTLVSRGRRLYYSGMIPEHLGGVYRDEDVQIDLKWLCERHGVRFVNDRVTALDREHRVVHTASGTLLPYDVAAFDVGGVNPQRPQAAIPTKPLGRIKELERSLRKTLADPAQRLRLVIAGGGAAGVEIALNVTGRFAGHGRLHDLDCTIVEPAPRILGSFPEGMSRYASRMLATRGTSIITASALRWDGEGPPSLSDGTPVPADEVLWATGTVGLPLFRDSGLRCDDKGFVRVDRSLRTIDDPRLFAAGDCATPRGLEHLRKVGVHAIKQGAVLRANLRATLETLAAGRSAAKAATKVFTPYPVAPLILSTGTRDAIWTAGHLWVHGCLMLRLKHFIDRRWIGPYQQRGFANAAWGELVGAEAAC